MNNYKKGKIDLLEVVKYRYSYVSIPYGDKFYICIPKIN